MYSNAHKGILPSCAPLSEFGYPHDWIYWQKSRDVRNSAIARYVNVTKETFICPSDYLPTHLHPQTNANYGPYNFSYTMNQLLGSYASGPPPIRVTKVKRPSQMILFVEQEDTGIDDGMWCPSWGNTDYLATVHDKTAKVEKQFNTGNYMPNPKSKGNVAFLDCHVEYIAKQDAHNPKNFNPHMPR